MKAMLYLFPVLLLAIAACNKNEDAPAGSDGTPLPKTTANLAGKWQLKKSFIATGAPGEWKDPTKDTYLTFLEDGTVLELNRKYTMGVHPWSRTDTVLLFYKEGTVGDTTYQSIGKLTPDSLGLSGIGCIEGCGAIYVRVKK